MVDPARLRRLLETLASYRSELARLGGLPIDEYVSGHRYAGRYLVQACAQACIDVASHVIASEGWRTPTDFRDTFTVLEEQDVLSAPLAARLRDLAGTRNLLVHAYGQVDDALVHGFLRDGLADLDAFARTIAGLLD